MGHVTENVELTVLCLIQDGNKMLLQNRVKEDWKGYSFPGDHVEAGESFVDAVVREMKNILIENIDRVHTTDMGVDRIRKNLGLVEIDVVAWCKEKIIKAEAEIERHGKNWYVHIDGCVITVNASSYTIITCH